MIKDLIRKRIEKKPEASNREVNLYVSSKTGIKYQLSGSLIKKVRDKIAEDWMNS